MWRIIYEMLLKRVEAEIMESKRRNGIPSAVALIMVLVLCFVPFVGFRNSGNHDSLVADEDAHRAVEESHRSSKVVRRHVLV